jgi:bacterioferritin-associated ferredoxin
MRLSKQKWLKKSIDIATCLLERLYAHTHLRIILIIVTIARMIICVCNNINESRIHRAAREGNDSFEALQVELGVAMCCGKCASAVHDTLAQCAGKPCHAPAAAAQPKRSSVHTVEPIRFFEQLTAA